MQNAHDTVTERTTLWTKEFVLICAVYLFFSMCQRLLDSNLAPFASTLWNSKTLGGYLTSAFTIGAIIAALFAGRMIDLKGRRNVILAGALLFGFSSLAMAFWPFPAMGIAARVFQGAAKSVLMVGATTVVSDIVPKSRMNEGMGYYNIGGTVSMATGPMIGLVLVEYGSYSQMFLFTAACCLAMSALCAGINYEKKHGYQKPGTTGQPNTGFGEYRGIWKLLEKKAVMYSINNTVFAASYTGILVFVTVYAQDYLLLNSVRIGLFFTVAAVTMLPVRLFCSRFGDTHGVLVIIVPGHACMMLALIFLSFFAKGSFLIFLAAGALYGLGFASVFPAFNAATVVDSPTGRSNIANATFFFVWDFGILFASAFFGMLIDAAGSPEAGYMHMYLISLGVCIISLLMSLALLNERARERRRRKC